LIWKVLLRVLLLVVLLGLSSQAYAISSDVECLARNDYYEARGESSFASRIAIANVVLNRVKHGSYPKSVCAVVHETRDGACQFSWYCANRFDIPKDREAWKVSLGIARMVLDKDRRIADPTHGALHYVEKSANVSWAKGFKNYVTLGNHRFYFERKEYP